MRPLHMSFLIFLTFILAAAWLYVTFYAKPVESAEYPNRIEMNLPSPSISVIDGDTFQINYPVIAGPIVVRLFASDAPEKKQKCYNRDGNEFPCAMNASDELSRILSSGSMLVCEKKGISYERTVMKCSVDNEDISLRMIREGLAFFAGYARGQYRETLKKAEAAAEKEGIGVWRQDRPVRPSAFRHRR